MGRRTLTLILAALILAWAGGSLILGQGAVEKPKLVLVISVGQMRFDYLTRFGPLYKGGFRRLLNEGAVFRKAMVRHANTVTSTGHAVMLSGRYPSQTGIIGDRWYDSKLNKTIQVLDDPKQFTVGGPGSPGSPVHFIGQSLVDVLKERSPQSRVVAVSLKDRPAVLMAGRKGDAAYWYDSAGGCFISSTYYMDRAPAWLEKWNGQRYADRYAGKPWTRLLPDEKLYVKFAGVDAVEGEWDRREIRFPHSIRGNPPQIRFYDDFRRTPFADEMTLDVALEALKGHQLGSDEFTDILAIGFTASDVIGHTYGADSQEIMDEFLRLDTVLEKLFREVDTLVGMSRTLVVLTSDHGSLPLVEVLQAQGKQAHRASPKDLEATVEEALRAKFPHAKGLISHYDAPHFYLNAEEIHRSRLSLESVEAAITRALLSTDLVDAVYTRSQMLSQTSSKDPYLQLYRNGFNPERSPDVMVRLKKYIYLDDRIGGTGHGSPYDYDRHVPLIFMGQNLKPGRYSRPCGLEEIAPTLARLLGFEYPRERGSRLLLEMIR
jgi:predicted AlkP superfamily pyrophosphatase or phosphodiesterase